MSTELEVFAVREKNTQDYLPAKNGSFHSANGLKAYNLNDNGDMPRLFMKKKQAKGALQAWLRGEWAVDDSTPFLHRPVSERSRKDMEIVTVRVIFPD